MDGSYAKPVGARFAGASGTTDVRAEPPRMPTLIGEATQSVSFATSRVWQVAAVLREFSDQTLGAQPEPANSINQPDSHNRAEQLRGNLADMERALDYLEEQAKRLSSI